MKHPLEKFYAFLDRPLFMSARVILALAVIPLALAFTQPLWRISMEAPQYPDGLWMDIYTYKIEGGNEGQHLTEINTLNHYIGMHPLDRNSMSDLDWIPFALGFLAIFTLRVAAIGDVRSLLDLAVLTSYISLFALGRFVYRLYVFGHDLAPNAPVKVPPFMPVVLGSKQIANFTTHSYPQLGTALMGLFALAVLGTTLWHLVSGRRSAARAERDTSARTAPATV